VTTLILLSRASTLPSRYYTDPTVLEPEKELVSRSYGTGRFSAKRENGVYHFQSLVSEFLQEDA
jgi:hypothetical protein